MVFGGRRVHPRASWPDKAFHPSASHPRGSSSGHPVPAPVPHRACFRGLFVHRLLGAGFPGSLTPPPSNTEPPEQAGPFAGAPPPCRIHTRGQGGGTLGTWAEQASSAASIRRAAPPPPPSHRGGPPLPPPQSSRANKRVQTFLTRSVCAEGGGHVGGSGRVDSDSVSQAPPWWVTVSYAG